LTDWQLDDEKPKFDGLSVKLPYNGTRGERELPVPDNLRKLYNVKEIRRLQNIYRITYIIKWKDGKEILKLIWRFEGDLDEYKRKKQN
jgi:hypothetical protein